MTAGLVCVDASTVIRLLLAGSTPSRVTDLWLGWENEGARLIAPSLLYCELVNALHRYSAHGDLLPEEAAELLAAALALEIDLYSDAELHRRALELAQLHHLTAAYDAHYLALAERFQADFWTADRRLAQAVQAAAPWMHLLE
jgi:predicted nucleic acid-binding protein